MLIAAFITAAAFTGPEADPAAIVQCSSTVRLTILTEKVVRAERVPEPWLPFNDIATLQFVERNPVGGVPKFSVVNTSSWCNVTVKDGLHVVLRKQPPQARASTCDDALTGRDAVCHGHCHRVGRQTVANATKSSCCAACDATLSCSSWVLDTTINECYLLGAQTVEGTRPHQGRIFGGATTPSPPGPSTGLRAHGVLEAWSDAGAGWRWKAWLPDSGNLLGTLPPTPSADLAGCCHNINATAGKYDPKYQYSLQDGLISRDGAVSVDDASTPLYDVGKGGLSDAWLFNGTGVAGREDIYLFGCGLDYRGCLADYVSLAGPMAMPTQSSLGVWWSRHWGNPHNIPWGKEYFGAMTETNVMEKVVVPYQEKGLPLHVLVMDMEWHEMFAPKCYQKGPGAWGGYTWNTSLFADPGAFITKLHASRGPVGIKVAVNTHPDEGIDACQEGYAAMAAAIGADSSKGKTLTDLGNICGTSAAHPEVTCTRKYVEAYFRYMIDPIGADYSWTDEPSVTTFSNELYVRYPGTKKKKRTINFSRYGGRGQHRTPIGFSGDTLRRWDTLAYQTYFTPRAANVAFGWWSHDIGGFSGNPVDDVFHTEGPELYLRWLQFATFAPIFRTHCRYCEQRIWTWGDSWFRKMRIPMVMRSNLVPYIYTHAMTRSHSAGEALLTPTFWDPASATHDEAYAPEYGRQYFFGRDLLVAPIAQEVDAATNTTERSVWLPPGSWEPFGAGVSTTAVLSGPVVTTANYGLDDIPVFIRSGAVIPTRTMASAYSTTADPLVWIVAAAGLSRSRLAGGLNGTGVAYEDDGESLEYQSGSGCTTQLDYTSAPPSSGKPSAIDVIIHPREGNAYSGMKATRANWVVLHGVATMPAEATCGNAADGQKPAKTWVARPGDAPGPMEIVVFVPSIVIACTPILASETRTMRASW